MLGIFAIASILSMAFFLSLIAWSVVNLCLIEVEAGARFRAGYLDAQMSIPKSDLSGNKASMGSFLHLWHTRLSSATGRDRKS